MTAGLVVDGLLFVVTSLAALPAVVFFVQIASAVWRRAPPSLPYDNAPRTADFAVLMPAHDEAGGIETAVRAVRAQCGPRDRLLVVADNCTDATARLARAAGAEVVERVDPARRGKGYALDFGVRRLEARPPAVVIVVDADCLPAPGALERLVRRCMSTRRPVQALYLMRSPPGAGVGARIAEFAWLLKNRLRPAGSAAWGAPCQLMGTGMAFPWAMIRDAPLASGHIVEDMQLGIALAIGGGPPLFCEDALVESVFPVDKEGARSQRTRWEHGHLSMIATAGPRLLGLAFIRKNLALFVMALDLMVPPLASLALGLGVIAAADAVWWAVGGSGLPVALAALAFSLLIGGVLLAWHHDGRRLVAGRELFGLPIYIFAKVPLYVRLFTQRQVDWVRTKRDERRP